MARRQRAALLLVELLVARLAREAPLGLRVPRAALRSARALAPRGRRPLETLHSAPPPNNPHSVASPLRKHPPAAPLEAALSPSPPLHLLDPPRPPPLHLDPLPLDRPSPRHLDRPSPRHLDRLSPRHLDRPNPQIPPLVQFSRRRPPHRHYPLGRSQHPHRRHPLWPLVSRAPVELLLLLLGSLGARPPP